MFPELARIGSFVIATKSVFVVVAFLMTAFIFWRKAREEHYHEEQIFDAFLLAVIMGMVIARVGFVLLHLGEFASQPWLLFDIVGRPGSILEIGMLGATAYLYRYAKAKKWDAFEVLDFWFLAAAAGLIFVHLGNLFAGVGFGYETSLPWGLVFPGVFTKHHPVQLYSALFFVAMYHYLNWAEYRYRTFGWYRANKKTAQTGFLTSVFLIGTGIYTLGIQSLLPPQFKIAGISLFMGLSALAAVVGVILLYHRSGHSFSLWPKKDHGLQSLDG